MLRSSLHLKHHQHVCLFNTEMIGTDALFCGNVVVGDSRYCPRCGAWNKTYDSQFYDLYDDVEDEDYGDDYEDDDCEEQDE